MNVDKVIRDSKIFLKRHSSTILTCVGAAGVIVTSVLAVKATPKALALLEEAKAEKEEELTKLEIIEVAGPAYIPAILTGAATITCIFGANVLNKQQQASLMSAYALLENSYKEYQSKAKELYGKDADERIKQEIVRGMYKTKTPSNDDKQLFFDFFTMEFFESTIEEVMAAEEAFNRILVTNNYASLNEYCDVLGIPRAEYGFELGWSSDLDKTFYGYSWIDFEHEKAVMSDGLECTIITMSREPEFDYLDY